eukprot:Gb_31521 [translate_table: standard]
MGESNGPVKLAKIASTSISGDAKFICPSTGKPCDCGAKARNDSFYARAQDPLSKPIYFNEEFKQAHHMDDGIALINASMQVFLEEKDETWAVVEASLGYSGITPVPFSTMKIAAFLKTMPWAHQTLQAAKDIPSFEEFVTCVGQVIGIVVVDTCGNAKIASQNIQVEYEELPVFLHINDAQVGSFHPNTEKLL